MKYENVLEKYNLTMEEAEEIADAVTSLKKTQLLITKVAVTCDLKLSKDETLDLALSQLAKFGGEVSYVSILDELSKCTEKTSPER